MINKRIEHSHSLARHGALSVILTDSLAATNCKHLSHVANMVPSGRIPCHLSGRLTSTSASAISVRGNGGATLGPSKSEHSEDSVRRNSNAAVLDIFKHQGGKHS